MRPEGDVTAGSWGTWDIIYTVGSHGIAVGGGIRIIPPYQGMTRWQLGKVEGFTSRVGAGVEVKVENACPVSYHWRRPPVIEVTVTGCPLEPEDKITTRIGARGMLWSGFFVRARATEFAMKNAMFDVYVDVNGAGQQTREFQIQKSYLPLSKTLAVNIVPDKPARFSVFARAPPTEKDVRFPILISVEDQYGNPVSHYRGKIRIDSTDSESRLSQTLNFTLKDNGTKILPYCELNPDQVHYVSVCDTWNSLIGKSNPISAGFVKPYRIYFGDTHVMTGRGGKGKKRGGLLEESLYMKGNALGDSREAFLYGKNRAGLDFVCATNSCQTEEVWKVDQIEAEYFNKSHEFVTLLSFELGTAQGHRNVIYLKSPQPFFPGNTFREVFDFLQDKMAITIPHHTNVCSESSPGAWTALDWDTYDPRFDRLVEITQNRGSFETDDKREGEYFGGFGSSVQDALSRGYRLGFVGGTDNHRAQPGSRRSPMAGLDYRDAQTGVLTAVMAPELTRKTVWKALWDRRCYATSGERILLKIDINGHGMGEEVKVAEGERHEKSRKVYIKIAGTDKIGEVDIVRNNVDVYTHKGKNIVEEVVWTDRESLSSVTPTVGGDEAGVFYYVRVTQNDGEKAWSSPVWFLL